MRLYFINTFGSNIAKILFEKVQRNHELKLMKVLVWTRQAF